MAESLTGKTIAFLAAEGVEQVELTEPWKAVERGRRHAELISVEDGEVQAFNHLDKADTFTVDKTVADADAADYDGLVLPGGVANPDFLRTDDGRRRASCEAFFEQAKPVGVICHGPWTLVEADVVKGRTMTSWPSLKTDIENAGGELGRRGGPRRRGPRRARATRTISRRSAPRSSRSSPRASTSRHAPRRDPSRARASDRVNTRAEGLNVR